MSTIGENIKKYRKAMRLTQSKIGEYIGINASSVSKIERGETVDIKSTQIETLCKLFHCTPSDLYGMDSLKVYSSTTLTADQQELLALIPLLNAEEAKALLEMVKAMFGYKKHAGL